MSERESERRFSRRSGRSAYFAPSGLRRRRWSKWSTLLAAIDATVAMSLWKADAVALACPSHPDLRKPRLGTPRASWVVHIGGKRQSSVRGAQEARHFSRTKHNAVYFD
jgi:hypothetical protein